MGTTSHPPELIVHEPLIIINVEKAISEDLTQVKPANVHAALSKFWRGMPQRTDTHQNLILARNSDYVIGVFRVMRWIQNPSRSNEWGMAIEPAEIAAQLRYVGKKIPQKYKGGDVALYQPED